MSHDATATVPAVHHRSDAGARRRDETLVIEAPLEIRCNGGVVATTMRTPGHDEELAVGFCRGEGYLVDNELREVRYSAGMDAGVDVVDVHTTHPVESTAPRLGTVSSSCGVCGSTRLESLTSWLDPRPGVESPLSPALLDGVAATIRREQVLFDGTGGTHAAALFDRETGEVLVVREDIGRHNAVDKVVGAAGDRLPTPGDGRGPSASAPALGLWISGRASFEMMQKAWSAGCSTLVSVSAVSALALEIAVAAEIELIGFARPTGHTTYHAALRAT